MSDDSPPSIHRCVWCSGPPGARETPKGRPRPERPDPPHPVAGNRYERPRFSPATAYHKRLGHRQGRGMRSTAATRVSRRRFRARPPRSVTAFDTTASAWLRTLSGSLLARRSQIRTPECVGVYAPFGRDHQGIPYVPWAGTGSYSGAPSSTKSLICSRNQRHTRSSPTAGATTRASL